MTTKTGTRVVSHTKPASMQDVADAVGVSRATVSNALRGKGRLSPETLQLIQQAAERLNYVPSNLGRALRTGKSRTVGLVIPDFRMPLFAEFARAFAMAADRRDMVLSVADAMGSHATQSRHMAEFAARGVDMLVVIPVRGTPVEQLPANALVLDSANNPRNSVSSDHFEGGRMMAHHLADLGHQQVMLLDADRLGDTRGPSLVNDMRRQGFAQGFAERGITPLPLSLPARFDEVRAAFMTMELGKLTAIAATYDALALGVLHALLARGIKVPDDISVTGFDATVWGQIMHPPLTSLRQDLDALAETAFAIAAGEADAGQILPVELLAGGSCAQARVFSSVPLAQDVSNA